MRETHSKDLYAGTGFLFSGESRVKHLIALLILLLLKTATKKKSNQVLAKHVIAFVNNIL